MERAEESGFEGHESVRFKCVADLCFDDGDFAGATWSDCEFERCTFQRAALDDATIERCVLTHADFRGADLRGLHFKSCDLQGAKFLAAKLDGTKFEDCTLTDALFDPEAVTRIELLACHDVPSFGDGLIPCWGILVAPAVFAAVASGHAPGVALRGCKPPSLPGCMNLAGADLRGANFSLCEVLQDVNFAGADLSAARLGGPSSSLIAEECDFTEVNLDGADLRGLEVHSDRPMLRPRLRGLKTAGARLGAIAEVDWRGEDLRKVIHQDLFEEARDLDLRESDLRGVFSGARIDGLDLRGADARKARFYDAVWTRVDARGARFEGAEIRCVDLTAANFEGAVLDDALLTIWASNIDLRGASLRRVHADGDSCHLAGAVLDGADLRGANLRGFNLSGASLKDARLDGAEIVDCVLDGADLTGASIRGAVVDESASLVIARFSTRGTPVRYEPPPPKGRGPKRRPAGV